MAQCSRCGARKLTEWPCSRCGNWNNRVMPVSSARPRREILIGPHQPHVQRQTCKMLRRKRLKAK